MSSLNEKLSQIQTTLNCPKSLLNKFGGYYYRSTESILEAVKPLLLQHKLVLTIDEDMKVLGGDHSPRFYKQIIASITDGKDTISVSSFTREDESQKGLTQSQLSGAVGSYGAKMALRGLFLLDDTQDDDATNTHGKEDKPAPEKPKVTAVVDQKAPESFKRKPKAVSAAKPSEDTEDDY
jgi:hypothetical protein